MLIQDRNTSSWAKRIRKSFSIILALSLLTNVGLAILVTPDSGRISNGLAMVSDRVQGVGRRVAGILDALVAMDSTAELAVNLTHRSKVRLEQDRETAMALGRGDAIRPKEVDAWFEFQGKRIEAKIRLAGGHSDHWSDPGKMSYRVKLPDDQIFGMRDFTLLAPANREYIAEYLFGLALAREGLIAKRRHFVRLRMNGSSNGIYQLEEGEAKELIEANRLREGAIIAFQSNFALECQKMLESGNCSQIPFGASDFSSSLITWEKRHKRSLASDKISAHETAVALVHGVRAKKVRLRDAFDLDKMARYLALRAIFGSSELDQNDSRFYLNPVTSRLEPIGDEIHFTDRTGDWWLNQSRDRKTPFVEMFLSDEEFLEKYLTELYRVSRVDYLDKLLAETASKIRPIERVLALEYPLWNAVEQRQALYRAQKNIRSHLTPLFMPMLVENKVGHPVSALRIHNRFRL